VQEVKKPRTRKLKESRKAQKNLNDKNAKKQLIRLINANFDNRDLAVHLTYDSAHLPECIEGVQRDVQNYFRRIKSHRRKQGLPELKYIAVMEYKDAELTDRGIRIHLHVVMSGMDRDAAEQLWGKGRVNADRLQADRHGYEGLARYIAKDPKGAKRWIQSKNLKQPVVTINDSRWSHRKVEQLSKVPDDRALLERLYRGFEFTEARPEVNPVTGEIHINIKMRQAGPSSRQEKGGRHDIESNRQADRRSQQEQGGYGSSPGRISHRSHDRGVGREGHCRG
jgi:hypothetical protein